MTHYYMYVVRCQDHTLYTGYTTDLERRMKAHNNGTGAKYTKIRRPVTLLYACEYATKSEALKAEYAFKQHTRAQKDALLSQKGALTHYPIIETLIQEDTHETKEL